VAELKIPGEKEVGKGGYYMTENEHGEKDQENHGKEMAGQNISNDFNRLKIDQYPRGEDKHDSKKG
jgi:hypothetical protein